MSSYEDFWKKQAEHSRVKTEIVVKYFRSWASIMKPRCGQLTYLDLFSGRGSYEDGTLSTPLRILDEVAGDTTLQRCLRVFFYEGNAKNFRELKSSVESHSAFHLMSIKPEPKEKVIKRDIISQLPIDDCTFCFIDPFGHKGVSLRLLSAVIRRWGSDCLFYLSTTGIRRNIEIKENLHDIEQLFGFQGLQRLIERLRSGRSREVFHRYLLEELKKIVCSFQRTYFLPFGIEFESRKTVSHYLVFLCKNHRGFSIMKQIMSKYSLCDSMGIPYFLLSPIRKQLNSQLEFGLSENMTRLMKLLCTDFSSQIILKKMIDEEYDKRGHMYIPRNIESALLKLRDQSKVQIRDPKGKVVKPARVLPSYEVKFI